MGKAGKKISKNIIQTSLKFGKKKKCLTLNIFPRILHSAKDHILYCACYFKEVIWQLPR